MYNDPSSPDTYPLSLHDALPIFGAELLDDLPGAGYALVLGPLTGGGDPAEVDPVAAYVQVFGVLVDAGHLDRGRSEEHTSELQSHVNIVCRLLLEKKKLMYVNLR